MIHIVAAMHAEVRPLIERWNMKRDLSFNGYDLFRCDDIALILSGIGKIKSAIATTRLLATLSDGEKCCVVNLGICGAPAKIERGTLLWINKLTDQASHRRFYPDNLVKHGLAEASLITYDRVLNSGEQASAEPVDMEASGFFEAANAVLPTSHIAILKLVSDHFDLSQISPDLVSKLVADRADEIERCIFRLHGFVASKPDVLTDTEKNLVARLREHLKLTASQSQILSDLACGAKLARPHKLTELDRFFEIAPAHKNDGRRIFEQVAAFLSAK